MITSSACKEAANFEDPQAKERKTKFGFGVTMQKLK